MAPSFRSILSITKKCLNCGGCARSIFGNTRCRNTGDLRSVLMTTAQSPITGLRYIALAMPNFDESLEFYTTLWGLEQVSAGDGVAYLGSPVDPAQYILRLRKAEAKRLDVVGLAAASRAEVDALGQRLSAAGVRIDRAPADLGTPGGGYGLRFFDCEGRLIEVSADVAPRKISGATQRGVPVNLGHVVFNTLTLEATKSFYETHLGLKLTDWLEDFMCFLRCNGAKHHILAIAKGPHVALNHVAYDMGGIDSQMRATGRLVRAGQKIVWGPGRHGAGDNTFSYFKDPAGNVCEFTAEMEGVDEANWKVRRWETKPEMQDQWGTGGLITDGMIPAQFNTPDTGLWTPAPV
ncbi:VOC family protein [Acidocella sp. KAb 2-4]|uniref:VOC family protein n=1 Tax=Acidocella sp. KAb 2-4 TaxID=2885158 RepID=UPI001D078AE9|nr:VOC family protein [Acidocella sp. KAb 2-4]